MSLDSPEIEGTESTCDDQDVHREEEIEVEMALLAMLASRDVGTATEAIHLDTLSPTEKQVLLQMMRDRIGYVETIPRDAAPNSDFATEAREDE